MAYEVRVTRHWSGKTYNVDLVSWQRGEGMASGRAFNVSKSEAEKVAAKSAKIYNAQISWEDA
jgi:hypothetical protein